MNTRLKQLVSNKAVVITGVLLLLTIIALIVMVVLMNTTRELSAKEYQAKAESYLQDKKYEDAIVYYEKALAKDPTLLASYSGEAKAYLKINGTGNATELFNKAIKLIEETFTKEQKVPEGAGSIYYQYADFLVASEDNEAAYELLKQGEELIPDLLNQYDNEKFVNPEDNAYVNEDGYVVFGSYPQTQVQGALLTKEITDADYNQNEIAQVGDAYYKRLQAEDKSYTYYLFEPIKWRVINTTEDGYLLLADRALDAIPYNDEYVDSSWDTSTLRSWINGYFYDIAFNEEDHKDMQTIQVTPSKNPDYGIITGVDVEDYVCILSAEEISEGANGFDGDRKTELESRLCDVTDYSQAVGVGLGLNNMCKWWVRTCGVDMKSASYVNYNGIIACDGYFVIGTNIGVRPAIFLSKDAVEITQ